MVTITPSDSIQTAINNNGGPGAEIRLSAGTYNQNIALSWSNPNHNGTFANPLRIIIDEGVTWQPGTNADSTIRLVQNKYITIENNGTVVGSTGEQGGLHAFGDSDNDRSVTGLTLIGGTWTKKGTKDGLKLSETIGTTLTDVTVESGSGATGDEELIDFNKGCLATVTGLTLNGTCGKALVFKGGFTYATVDGLTGNVSGRGGEIGGYPGTGPWGRLERAIANGGTNFDSNDPHESDFIDLLNTAPYTAFSQLEWAAREIYYFNVNLTTSGSGYRFIGAYDCRINGTWNEGSVLDDSTRFTSNNVGANGQRSEFCSNLWVNGVQEVASVGGYTLPTPPDGTPEAGPPVLPGTSFALTVNVP
jgi:hypothetical protein